MNGSPSSEWLHTDNASVQLLWNWTPPLLHRLKLEELEMKNVSLYIMQRYVL